jgi:hypothetical protein
LDEKLKAVEQDRFALRDNLAKKQEEAEAQTRRANDLASQLSHAQEVASTAWKLNNEISLSPEQQSQFHDLEKKVEDLNADLSSVRVRLAPWPTFVDRHPLAIYEIYSKNLDGPGASLRGAGLFRFDAEKYRIQGDSQKGLTEELATNIGRAICRTVASGISNSTSLRDAFSAVPELKSFRWRSRPA